jgi:tripartite-type tricarboxylate transporter receptor subunit TctC
MNWNFWRVGAVLALLVVVLPPPAQAQNWPTRAVRFMVPFGPGAGADIGARLFAEKLQTKWGQPVVIENKPGGDGIVAIQAYLGANDDHVLMFGLSGGFVVHPFMYSNMSYNQADLIPIARVSNTILAVAVKKDAHTTTSRSSRRQRARLGHVQLRSGTGTSPSSRSGAISATKSCRSPRCRTATSIWPRSILAKAASGRDVGACHCATAVAGRPHKLSSVTNKKRVTTDNKVPTDREQGYPTIEMEGMEGRFGIKSMSEQLKEKIAADVREVTADGSIGDRLEATGQILNVGGPKEFASSIAEQSDNVAAVVKAIGFKPKN